MILRENMEGVAEVGAGVDVDDATPLERPLDRLVDVGVLEQVGHLAEFRDEDERSNLREGLLKRITELQHESRDICDRRRHIAQDHEFRPVFLAVLPDHLERNPAV